MNPEAGTILLYDGVLLADEESIELTVFEFPGDAVPARQVMGYDDVTGLALVAKEGREVGVTSVREAAQTERLLKIRHETFVIDVIAFVRKPHGIAEETLAPYLSGATTLKDNEWIKLLFEHSQGLQCFRYRRMPKVVIAGHVDDAVVSTTQGVEEPIRIGFVAWGQAEDIPGQDQDFIAINGKRSYEGLTVVLHQVQVEVAHDVQAHDFSYPKDLVCRAGFEPASEDWSASPTRRFGAARSAPPRIRN